MKNGNKTDDTSRLLLVTAQGIDFADNGAKTDDLWIEHPEQRPFAYTSMNEEAVRASLADFERLCVNTNPDDSRARRWSVRFTKECSREPALWCAYSLFSPLNQSRKRAVLVLSARF